MKIIELTKRKNIDQDERLKSKYDGLEKLINALTKRDLPSKTGAEINQFIGAINAFTGSNKELRKQIRKSYHKILRLVEKELKLVPKNLYRSRWMAIGISIFGVPMGAAFGASMDNMSFLGIGIPIGMVLGMAIGSGMDKKAAEEGRQLDL